MALVKNIEHDRVLRLTDQVEVRAGEITSRTLAQNESVSVTLFAFSAGEEIGTHGSTGDALVQVLEGTGRFTVGGTAHTVGPGESLVMPAGVPHSVFAETDFKWLLTVVFPEE